jgi:hypothetical protein
LAGYPHKLTTHASVVGLDVGLLDLTVLDDQGVALAAVVAEDGSGIKVEVESLSELAVRVGKEANLTSNASACITQQQKTRLQELTPLFLSASRSWAQAFMLR